MLREVTADKAKKFPANKNISNDFKAAKIDDIMRSLTMMQAVAINMWLEK